MSYGYDSAIQLTHDEWIRHSAIQLAADLTDEATWCRDQLIADAKAIAEYIGDPPRKTGIDAAIEQAVRDLDELLALPHDTPIPAERVKEIRDELRMHIPF